MLQNVFLVGVNDIWSTFFCGFFKMQNFSLYMRNRKNYNTYVAAEVFT